jgi:hypothetical protein
MRRYTQGQMLAAYVCGIILGSLVTTFLWIL